MNPRRCLLLGAGVQSSTLALMIARGLIEPIEFAIFADTVAEPRAVYNWIDWLESQVPFPIIRVRWNDGLTQSIERSVTDADGRFASPPFFAQTASGASPLRRQCTREFKVQPIERKLRNLLGIEPRKPGPKRVAFVQLFGISLDEIYRVKPSRRRWLRNEYPLIELRMTRHDCLQWMRRNGYPKPPRSACVYCPYRSDIEWRDLRDNDAEAWSEAIRIDALVRSSVRGVRDPLYVHRSMRPLAEVDFDTAEDRGQLSMFNNECEGLCGT